MKEATLLIGFINESGKLQEIYFTPDINYLIDEHMEYEYGVKPYDILYVEEVGEEDDDGTRALGAGASPEREGPTTMG